MDDFFQYDDEGKLHCNDGPAVRFSDGTVQYWVHGDVPKIFGDLLIVRKEIEFDFEMFPSAKNDPNIYYFFYTAYQFSDKDELVMALLRYS